MGGDQIEIDWLLVFLLCEFSSTVSSLGNLVLFVLEDGSLCCDYSIKLNSTFTEQKMNNLFSAVLRGIIISDIFGFVLLELRFLREYLYMPFTETICVASITDFHGEHQQCNF